MQVLPSMCRSLAGEQRDHWNELRRDGHQRDVLGFAHRLDVGKLLIVGLTFVMCDQLLHAFFVPARGRRETNRRLSRKLRTRLPSEPSPAENELFASVLIFGRRCDDAGGSSVVLFPSPLRR